MNATDDSFSSSLLKSTSPLVPAGSSIFVALSGGVDSAVVAMLLKQEGYKVFGVSHQHWPESRCCSTDCLDRCRMQCEEMQIPYRTIDCMVPFATQIVQDFVDRYEQGLTPNPCVLCNQKIRFGEMYQQICALPEFQHKSSAAQKPFIATGHYARIVCEDGHYQLHRGKDGSKDQSYMLYRLSSEQLAQCVFPLGDKLKQEVRTLASSWNLRSAKQKDSQDVCFVPGKVQDFLDQFSGTTRQAGAFIDREGHVLGEHKGVAYYTRGQRKGLDLSGGPWYVLESNCRDNTVVLGRKEDLNCTHFRITHCAWNVRDAQKDLFNRDLQVQLRYHAQPLTCRVQKQQGDLYHIELQQASPDVCPGQSAVFYDRERVMGGGLIARLQAA